MKGNLAIVYRGVDTIQEYENNSRLHSDEQVDKLVASIKEFGFINPVLIDAEGILVAGHGRLAAARKAGLDQVPCIEVGHLTEDQRRAYVIADNRLALDSEWDEDALNRELQALNDSEFDLSFLGFDDDELSGFLSLDDDSETQGLTEDDAVPDVEVETVSNHGDVWLLGGHRLLCGDSTLRDDLMVLLGEEGACDACWTDPPYNVAYEGGTGLKIQNDNMASSAFFDFLTACYANMAEGLKPGGPIYVAHADKEWMAFRKALVDAGFKLASCLVWAKSHFVLGRSDYQWKHEPILYGWKEGAAHKWYGGRKNTSVIEGVSDYPFTILDDGRVQIDLGQTSLVISGQDLQVEEMVGSVLRAEKPLKSKVHPTMKPVGLIMGMLKNSTRTGDKVLDLFGGSGSTLIACEKIGRRCRMMELDPKYADVIVRRWQEFTGQQAVRELDGLSFDDVVGSGS